MENWKPSEYWKRIIYIVRIPAKYQNCDIMTASQCFVGAVKAVRCDMDICNRYYRTMTSRNGHSRHSDCVHTLELIQQLRNKVLDSIQMVRQSCQKMQSNLGWRCLQLKCCICYSRIWPIAMLPRRIRNGCQRISVTFTSPRFWPLNFSDSKSM